MKINKNICLTALSVALLLPLGCKKGLLDQKDTSNISSDVLFHTAQDGISLVNSIYDGFQHDNQNFVLKSLWYNANYTAQDFFNWGADVSYNNYQFTSTFGSLNSFWDLSYQGIARANSAIPIIAQMLSQGVLTQDLANRLTGEAYFLRGCYYYYLACTFGGVPLELKTVTGDGLDPRNTEAEVWAAVAADMTKAATLLPWVQDAGDIGRATQGAALGYLGSADMWLKKYPDAIAAFNQMDAHYTLVTPYIQIHEYTNPNNVESVFELQFQNPAGGKEDWNANNNDNSGTGTNEVTWMSSFGMPWEITSLGYTYAGKNLYDSFEPGDTRKLATVIGPGDENPSPDIIAMGGIKSYPNVITGFNSTDAPTKAHYTGTDGKIINTVGKVTDVWTGNDNSQLRSGYYGVKTWRDPNVTGATTSPVDGIQHIFGDQNCILLRYGEILLSKAEAQFKTGDVAGATATMMRVRNRAWGGAAPLPSGTDFMQNMLNEYRHELAGDFSLWYDLRRTGLHIQYIKDHFGITIPSGHDLLPLPQQALDSNPTLVQNPNY
jgi:hypothetical protein